MNNEFRDIQKFLYKLGGCVVVVTDSWLIQCNVHYVNIIQQRCAVLKYVSLTFILCVHV